MDENRPKIGPKTSMSDVWSVFWFLWTRGQISKSERDQGTSINQGPFDLKSESELRPTVQEKGILQSIFFQLDKNNSSLSRDYFDYVNKQELTSNKQQSTLWHQQERVDETTAHHLQAPIINIDHWRSSTNLLITKDNKNITIDIYGNNNDNQPYDQRGQAKSTIMGTPNREV
jgi:hypothetical protein